MKLLISLLPLMVTSQIGESNPYESKVIVIDSQPKSVQAQMCIDTYKLVVM